METSKVMNREEFAKEEIEKMKKQRSPISPVDYTAIEAGENIQSADSMPNSNISESDSTFRVQLEKINDYIQYILPEIESNSNLTEHQQEIIARVETELEELYDTIKNKEVPKGTDVVEG